MVKENINDDICKFIGSQEALGRLLNDIANHNFKEFNKKIFDKPNRVKFKCKNCSAKCSVKVNHLKGLPECTKSNWVPCD